MAYSDSVEEIDKVLLKWLNVLDAFCYRYDRLNQIIRATDTPNSWKPAQQRSTLRKLLLLREQAGNTVATLLTDMSSQPARSSLLPPTYLKLQVHTSLLDELNRKIDAELNVVEAIVQVQ
ncbi:hypothetical protein [Spirosoma areae]